MCIHQLFEKCAVSAPNTAAVVAGDESLTYEQLNVLSSQLAHKLQSFGVGPEKIVGLFFDRSLELIVAILAVLKAGGAYLPLDRALPASRLSFMLSEVEAPLLLTQTHLMAEAPEGVARMLVVDLESLQREVAAPVLSGDASHLAYVIYTSGSTGKPKGVLIEHRSLANYIGAVIQEYKVLPGDRVLQLSSLSFDASVEEVFIALCSGATLVLRDDEMISSVPTFLQRCANLEISIIGCPTAFWHELVNLVEEEGVTIPACLRAVIIGGEQASADRLKVWQKHADGRLELFNTYGPTETTIAATILRVPEDWTGDRVPIGRPISGLETYVLDSDLRSVSDCKEGELYIGGAGVARGYLKRPELTEQKFISIPINGATRRLYKTGDRVRRMSDGNLVFVGRIDHQVKIGGFRVEINEIELALERHPKVKQAVVLAREDKGGRKQLVSYVVGAGELQPDELREFLGAHLPRYMVPARFVFMDKFPVTPTGKVDRQTLPRMAGQPETGKPREWRPRNPIELKLQVTFARFFDRTDIRSETSFFELGGDSLQALRIIVEIERALERKLPLGILFKAPTIKELAAILSKESLDRERSSLVPLQPHGTRTPFFLVHTTPGDVLGYGNFVYHLDPDQPCYAFQSLGLLSPEKAHGTIEEMARHYNRLMRTVQPHGPYFLGGWCYGGIVAVEMAQQLKLAGEEVALLALMETPAPPPESHRLQYNFNRLTKVALRSPGPFFKYLKAKWQYYRTNNNASELRFKHAQERWDKEEEGYYEKLEFLYNLNMEAVEKYRSRPYKGRVLLLNASDRDPAMFPDPEFGWGSLVSEIEVRAIPGQHDTILMEPYVGELAGLLNDYLPKKRSQVFGAACPSQSIRSRRSEMVFNPS